MSNAPYRPAGRSAAALDDGDLKFVEREIVAAREMLRTAHSITDRRERAEAIRVVLSKLELANRQITEVVQRRNGTIRVAERR